MPPPNSEFEDRPNKPRTVDHHGVVHLVRRFIDHDDPHGWTLCWLGGAPYGCQPTDPLGDLYHTGCPIPPHIAADVRWCLPCLIRSGTG